MATIVIKDLQESTELDRQAMQAIPGGSRFRTGGAGLQRQAPRKLRLFDQAPTAGAGRPGARMPPR